MKWIGEFWDFSQRSHPVFDWIFQGIGEGDYTIMISSPFLDGNGMMFTHLDRLFFERRGKALVMVLTDQRGMDVALKAITAKRYTNFHGVLMDAATPQSSEPSESGLHSHSKIYCVYRNLIPESQFSENHGASEFIRNRCHDFLNHMASESDKAVLGDPVQGSFGSANFTEKGICECSMRDTRDGEKTLFRQHFHQQLMVEVKVKCVTEISSWVRLSKGSSSDYLLRFICSIMTLQRNRIFD